MDKPVFVTSIAQAAIPSVFASSWPKCQQGNDVVECSADYLLQPYDPFGGG